MKKTMHRHPEKIIINKEAFAFERILKEDFFSVNVLYRNDQGIGYVLKLSDFRFIIGTLLRPFASFFSRREYKIYKMIQDIDGIPALGPRFGWRGFFHHFAEGKTLHEIQDGAQLPPDFFDKLHKIIAQLHERRIFYLDLNKRGNIIVGNDNNPYLIDFQVSIYFKQRRGYIGRLSDRIFNALAKEDIYHIYKHKLNFHPHLMTPEERELAVRTLFNEKYDRYWGTPYRRVKRLIYPSGSNEIIWYKWKRMKDRTKQMP